VRRGIKLLNQLYLLGKLCVNRCLRLTLDNVQCSRRELPSDYIYLGMDNGPILGEHIAPITICLAKCYFYIVKAGIELHQKEQQLYLLIHFSCHQIASGMHVKYFHILLL